MEAHEYGSCSTRPRVYILAVRCFQPHSQFSQLPQAGTDTTGKPDVQTYEFPQWWHQISVMMDELKVMPPLVSAFFLPLGHAARMDWREHPAHGSIDNPEVNKKSKQKAERPLWETDHIGAYQEAGLAWPPHVWASIRIQGQPPWPPQG